MAKIKIAVFLKPEDKSDIRKLARQRAAELGEDIEPSMSGYIYNLVSNHLKSAREQGLV